MALIEFKNLPDMSTPLNAENLNNNFSELENKIDKVGTIYKQEFTGISCAMGGLTNLASLNLPKGVYVVNLQFLFEGYDLKCTLGCGNSTISIYDPEGWVNGNCSDICVLENDGEVWGSVSWPNKEILANGNLTAVKIK